MHASLRLYAQASLLVSFFVTLSPTLAAQTPASGGTIRGQVADPQQRPVPGATIDQYDRGAKNGDPDWTTRRPPSASRPPTMP